VDKRLDFIMRELWVFRSRSTFVGMRIDLEYLPRVRSSHAWDLHRSGTTHGLHLLQKMLDVDASARQRTNLLSCGPASARSHANRFAKRRLVFAFQSASFS
jgi:hypothetical protein